MIVMKTSIIYLVLLIKFCDGLIDDPGVPLILTPLIETKQILKALESSKVDHEDFQGIESYSGFITVNKQYNSNMFFWFFKAEINYESAPVVLWLQGLPGASSLFGLFIENGPFRINNIIEKRDYRWTKMFSVIYVDNPVGAGFSYADYEGYCMNQTCVGENLYVFLKQFYVLFSELKNNELYICGENRAGKYAPALAYTIHKNNPNAEFTINLKGIAIGNGFIDPLNQMNYDEILYQLGYIDKKTKASIRALQTTTKRYILLRKWSFAIESFSKILYSSYSLFSNASGFNYFYNFLHDENYLVEDTSKFIQYVQKAPTRKALHLGNVTFQWLHINLHRKFYDDTMKSVTPWLTELLNSNKYKVLIYYGNLDLFLGKPQVSNMLDHLKFRSKLQYTRAVRYKWYVNGNLAGYVKKAGSLTEVMVRNAGHMVPYDQPEAAWELISKFIANGDYDLRN